MKPVCIVDTSSLINLSDVQLAHRSLHSWLWDEFEVRFSKAVLDEIRRHQRDMGRNRRRDWERYVYRYDTINTCERVLFSSLTRLVEAGRCRRCNQAIWREQSFEPDLDSPQDKGERHNCCVSLNIVRDGNFRRQVIYLTDDQRAVRDYVKPVFDVFPLGTIWSSLDFVLYIFVRHRPRIVLDAVLATLRDVNAKGVGGNNTSPSLARRLTIYRNRAEHIDRLLAQM